MRAVVTINRMRIIRIPSELCAAAGFRRRQGLALRRVNGAGVVFAEDQADRYPDSELFFHHAASDGSLALDMEYTFGLSPEDVVELEARPGEILMRPVLRSTGVQESDTKELTAVLDRRRPDIGTPQGTLDGGASAGATRDPLSPLPGPSQEAVPAAQW